MNKHKKLPRGVITAQITPLRDGILDETALESMLTRQRDAGVHGIVMCGTTGEASTLDRYERRRACDIARRVMHGGEALIVGSGSNSTECAVEYSKEAESLGADALLVVTPYYNKGTETGIINHYERICAATALPVIVYNVPTRTGVDLSFDTYHRLCEIDNVCGIKEASPSIDKIALLVREVGERIRVYSGNDMHYLPTLSLGGDGVISVASNALPEYMVRVFDCFRDGDIAGAVRENLRLVRFFSLIFKETSPAPIKYVCAQMGLCTGELRLPMHEVTDATKSLLDEEMRNIGV